MSKRSRENLPQELPEKPKKSQRFRANTKLFELQVDSDESGSDNERLTINENPLSPTSSGFNELNETEETLLPTACLDNNRDDDSSIDSDNSTTGSDGYESNVDDDLPLNSDSDDLNEPQPVNYETGNNGFESIQMMADDLNLKEPIFEGCEKPLIWVLIEFASILKEKAISKEVLGRVIDVVSCILPKPNFFPMSKYKFFDIVDKLCPGSDAPEIKFACSVCSFEFDAEIMKECPKCKKSESPSVFVINDVECIFRHMLETRGLAMLLDKHAKNYCNQPKVTDIMDGIVCKKIDRSSIYDIKLMHNTDGFPFANSAKKQLWPNFLAIANIPPYMRQKYIVLERLCFSPNKPHLLKFMIPFVQKMKKLGTEGFTWFHPVAKTEIKSKLIIVTSILDAQARAPIMNMNFYNGEYGCSFCEIECKGRGEGNGPGKLYCNTYINNRAPVKRTRNAVLDQANLLFGPPRAERDRLGKNHPSHIKGIRGYPPFSILPNFDVINSFSPDYLHSCLLGVVKRWTKHILSSKNHGKDFYVGRLSKSIDEKLLKIKVPSFVNRLPRCIGDIAYWKASEFRNWLFFYSLQCLDELLDKKFIDHHCLLVEAIFTLNKDSIEQLELENCRSLLKKYCMQYEKLYGSLEQTFNLHMLMHYVDSVEQIGPLWSTSTFIFENANGKLKRSIHGTSNVAVELINTAKAHTALYTLQHVAAILEPQIKKNVMLGARSSLTFIESFEHDVYRHVAGICTECRTEMLHVEVFLRAKISGIVYTSKSYTRASNTCSYYLAYVDDTACVKFAMVIFFVQMLGHKYFVGKDIAMQGPKFVTRSGTPVRHLKKFKTTSQVVSGKLSVIKYPLYEVLGLLSEPPNMHELNL